MDTLTVPARVAAAESEQPVNYKFLVNGRFRSHRVTGVQRYAIEICKRLKSDHLVVHPQRPLQGITGHLWEQAILPTLLKSRLLWSPSNTGPLFVHRQVVTIHDLATVEHPEWFSKQFSFLYRSMLPTLMRRALHIVAVSEFTKQRIIHNFGTDERKITAIPNGIEARFMPQPACEIERVTKRLGVPDGPYLLSVCSLEPRKNLPRLLAAWSMLDQLGVRANLVLAGAKGRPSVYQGDRPALIPERVVFTGYVPDEDLPALYSGARAFVYPSLYEGFGLPILEALASGTQVITSNVTSIPEVAGPSTVLVDPMNTHEIASAMETVLTEPPDPNAVACGIRHARRYTWDESARRTEDLLLSYC